MSVSGEKPVTDTFFRIRRLYVGRKSPIEPRVALVYTKGDTVTAQPGPLRESRDERDAHGHTQQLQTPGSIEHRNRELHAT